MRRHLHMNPELSFEEKETSAFVQRILSEHGIKFKAGIAGTGIVGMIEGKNPKSKTVALRADMDALPIQELNEVSYRSKNNGVMHACGHDVHTSSLIGAAIVLNSLKNDFEGSVKLLFQPAEEKLPGGASLMIEQGALENPAPSAVLGQHVMPLIETGNVGFRSGIYMASTDELYMTVKGKGGHGAMPHYNIDSVLITSHIIVAMQQIVSRNANPIMPSVVSFGKVLANGATNVIPDQVYVEGTFRTLDEKWRSDAHVKMKKLAEETASAMGGSLRSAPTWGPRPRSWTRPVSSCCRAVSTATCISPSLRPRALSWRMTSPPARVRRHSAATPWCCRSLCSRRASRCARW